MVLTCSFFDGFCLFPAFSYGEEENHGSPISIRKLTPIQMPHVDIDELKEGHKAFIKEEWMNVLLHSIGMEPDSMKPREKWLLLTRMIPLVENNFNLCELGPRSTGKSTCTRKFPRTVFWFPEDRLLCYRYGRRGETAKKRSARNQSMDILIACGLS